MKDSKQKAAKSKVIKGPNELHVVDDGKQSHERLLAELAFSPSAANASTARVYAAGLAGEIHITEAIDVLSEKAVRVQGGDMSEVESTLTAQAVALDAIFNGLAKRAASNMGTNLNATETYLRLALKAQSQCRTTLETLAEIKYPKAATFVRQQNVAYQQQVNNSEHQSLSRTVSRTRKSQFEQSKLLEGGIDERAQLDTETATAASRVRKKLEAMGKIYRAEESNGQS